MTYEWSSSSDSSDWRSSSSDIMLTSSSIEDGGNPSIWPEKIRKEKRKLRFKKNRKHRSEKNIYIWLSCLLKKFGWKIWNINVVVNDLILCLYVVVNDPKTLEWQIERWCRITVEGRRADCFDGVNKPLSTPSILTLN